MSRKITIEVLNGEKLLLRTFRVGPFIFPTKTIKNKRELKMAVNILKRNWFLSMLLRDNVKNDNFENFPLSIFTSNCRPLLHFLFDDFVKTNNTISGLYIDIFEDAERLVSVTYMEREADTLSEMYETVIYGFLTILYDTLKKYGGK